MEYQDTGVLGDAPVQAQAHYLEITATYSVPGRRRFLGLHGDSLQIGHADSVIAVPRIYLVHMLAFGPGPHASLYPGPGACPLDDALALPLPDPEALYANLWRVYDKAFPGWLHEAARHLSRWLLTIRASNRTVIYRLGGYQHGPDRYAAEWPD